jgi:DNA-binding NarL/FixJ family response regulator
MGTSANWRDGGDVQRKSGGRAERITVVVGMFAALLDQGLRQVLRGAPGIRVVGSGLDDAALQIAVKEYDARVVILDEARLASSSPLLEALRAERADLGVLVLAHRPSRAYALRVLGLGAGACLSSEATAEEIITAIYLLAEGGHMLAATSASPFSRGQLVGVLALTGRERGVLKLLSAGRSNAEIALQLRISVETTRTHVAHIYRKLGVNTRRELLGVDLPREEEPHVDPGKVGVLISDL